MTTFRLVVDSQQAAAFTQLGREIRSPDLALSLFQWDEDTLSQSIRDEILRLNHEGHTCFSLPKRDWKAAFFDLDSTVIAEESIVALADAAGKAAEVAEITEQAMAGLLDFTSALKERVRMIQGLPISVLSDVAQKLTINPGMPELIATIKAHKIKAYLVSGGFNALASGIVRKLGFDGFIANELDIQDDHLSGEVRGTIINAEAKAKFLLETCTALAIHPNDCFVVGDGANDLLMMQAAGAAIGYHPKAVLLPHINGANFHDHKALALALS